MRDSHMPTIEDMNGHIDRLCKAHKVEWCPETLRRRSLRGYLDAESNPGSRIIFALPARSVYSYAVAMHELGHVLGDRTAFDAGTVKRMTQLNCFIPVEDVEAEIDAWQWAFARAIPATLPALYRIARAALKHYASTCDDPCMSRAFDVKWRRR